LEFSNIQKNQEIASVVPAYRDRQCLLPLNDDMLSLKWERLAALPPAFPQ
jgi:hypothetical protein